MTEAELLTLADRAAAGLGGLDRKALFAELDARYDDLVAALERALAAGALDDALRLVRPLPAYWTASGRLDEGTGWLARVLATPGGDDAARGRACFDAGLMAFWQGEDERAAELFRDGLDLGRRAADPGVAAVALTGLARIALRTDLAEARARCEEALAEAKDDRRGRTNALHVLGVAAQMAGDLTASRELMSERMTLARELGEFGAVASEAGNLSVVERQLGNLDRAEDLAHEALEIAAARDDEWLVPYLLSGLAAIDAERGEHERAAGLVGTAEAMMEAQGVEWPPDERPHYERTVATLITAMGSAPYEEARALGRATPWTEASERTRARARPTA